MDGLPFYHVPGGIAYMDCQCCANNGSLPSMGRQPAEPMFRSRNEAASPYDLNKYIMQFARNCSPLALTAPLELSSRSPPLIDMVQAAEQLAALNSGSYYAAEYPGLASSSKSYDARYDSTSPEDIDSLFRRPVPEFKDSPNCSRLSSADILQPICDGEVRFAGVTASNVAHGQGIPHSNQEDEELTMATALEMEKILRDHFQGASEPSSHPCTTTSLRSWTSTYNPNSTWTRELMDPPLVESTWPSSSQVECNMSSGPSQSGLPIQQSAPLASSQELTLWRPGFNRPAEGTRTVGEFKGKRKLQQTSLLAGGCELYEGPSPLVCATPRGGVKSRRRSSPMTMGGSEPPRLNKPKRRRTRNRKGDSAGETQRMTHIAVERNRRRQMNDHLRALKDLMPSGFVQKTDQASVIGAAVEFVKRLEVIADSLLSKQKIRQTALAGIPEPSQWTWLNIQPRPPLSAGASSSAAGCPPSQLSAVTTSQPRHSVYQLPSKPTIMSPELFSVLPQNPSVNNEIKVESRSDAAMIEVKLLEKDARVEILTHRRAEQVVKLIVAMESLDLAILYTEVTTKPSNAVFYKFEAEVGPERRMTAGQIAAALHQTFVDNIHTNYTSSPSGI